MAAWSTSIGIRHSVTRWSARPFWVNAEYREMAGRFRLRAPLLILLPDLPADPLPHPFRELVNQRVQVLVQLTPPRLCPLFQLAGQRV